MTTNHHITAVDAQVCAPLAAADRKARFTTAAEAIEWALAEVGPNQTQVSLTAHTADISTWANRHFTWHGGDVNDSGWRLWIAGQFVGGGDLADLATRPTAAEVLDRCRRLGVAV